MRMNKKLDKAALDKRLEIRLSEGELLSLKSKAKEAGYTLSEYVRRSCLDGKVIARKPFTDMALIKELMRQGVNLNQYTQKLNALGKHAPDDMRALSLKIEQVLKRIEEGV